MSYTANTTVPNLQAATAVSDSDLVVVNQGGVTKKAAVLVIENKVLSAKSVLSGATANTDRLLVRRGTTMYDVELSSLLPASSVGPTQIADNAVTGSELQNSASTDNDRAVSTNHIKSRAVTGAKIATSTILQEHLTDNSVGAAQLQDLSVDAGALQVGAVSQLAISKDVGSIYTASGVRGETRPINPWSTFLGLPTGPKTWPAQANKATETSDTNYVLAATLRNHEIYNRYCDWFLSVQECAPVFPAWTRPGTTSDNMKGGAYSGGVLLPDGKVFLVPYNAQPAIYDPVKDTLTNVAWPGGVLPFTAPYYAGYSGGVLLSAPPSVGGVNGGRSGAGSPAFSDGPVVVCAPFFAKKALVYNVQTGVCTYGNTVSGLPNRAFGGIVALGSDKIKSGNRVAVAVPHASGKPYLIDSTGNMTVSSSADRSSGYGAGFNASTDVAFGTLTFVASSEDTTASAWASGNTDYPTLAVNSAGSATRLITVNQTNGHFLVNGNTSAAVAKTPMPTGGTVQGYRVSGLVRMADGYVVAVPGYWGASHTPSVLLFDSQDTQSSSPQDAIAIPIPGLQANISATGDFANTFAPGNGLFSGGVLLPDGRVFLVPCTSTKAYIISTRRPATPLPEELALGPYLNKR
jgi:hypothetical protein